MSANGSPGLGRAILRGVTLQQQPRPLLRPRVAEPSATDAVPMSTVQDAGFEQGFAAGHAAGLQQGLADAQRRIDEGVAAARVEFDQSASSRLREFDVEAEARLGRLDRLLSGVDGALRARVGALEADAVDLAFAAVCQVLGEQAGKGEAVARLVQRGLESLRSGPLVAVRLNEVDLRALQSHPLGHQLLARAPQVRWIADASVTAGGCLFESLSGTLDARLDIQLAALRAKWSEVASMTAPQEPA